MNKYLLDIMALAVGSAASIWLYRKYKTTKYVSFINYIPNLWTSLGILGTFVSIYMSLNRMNFTAVLNIPQLVQMLAPAFSTSIIGIIGAVVSSMLIRFHRAGVDVREEESYVATIKNIERQVNSLGSGAREIAKDMGREMVAAAGDGLRESLYQHVRAMSRAMEQEEKNFAKVAESISENLKSVSAAYNETMKELYLQYKGEAESVKKDCELALKELKGQMCREFEKLSENHVQQLNAVSAKQIEHLGTIDGVIKSSVQQEYLALAQQISATSGEISGLVVSLNETREGIAETVRSVTAAGEAVKRVNSSLETTQKKHQDYQKSVDKLVKYSEKVVDSMPVVNPKPKVVSKELKDKVVRMFSKKKANERVS